MNIFDFLAKMFIINIVNPTHLYSSLICHYLYDNCFMDALIQYILLDHFCKNCSDDSGNFKRVFYCVSCF